MRSAGVAAPKGFNRLMKLVIADTVVTTGHPLWLVQSFPDSLEFVVFALEPGETSLAVEPAGWR